MLFYQGAGSVMFLFSDNVLKYSNLQKPLMVKCNFLQEMFYYISHLLNVLFFLNGLLIVFFFFFSICSRMGITGVGLMIVQAAGAVTVPPTTARLTRHGGLGKAASASQLDDGDTLCCLTLWCRYVHPVPVLPEDI